MFPTHVNVASTEDVRSFSPVCAGCQHSDILSTVLHDATLCGMRLFERFPPGLFLLCPVAAIVTLAWGLRGAAGLVIGVVAGVIAFWLDNAGL